MVQGTKGNAARILLRLYLYHAGAGYLAAAAAANMTSIPTRLTAYYVVPRYSGTMGISWFKTASAVVDPNSFQIESVQVT